MSVSTRSPKVRGTVAHVTATTAASTNQGCLKQNADQRFKAPAKRVPGGVVGYGLRVRHGWRLCTGTGANCHAIYLASRGHRTP